MFPSVACSPLHVEKPDAWQQPSLHSSPSYLCSIIPQINVEPVLERYPYLDRKGDLYSESLAVMETLRCNCRLGVVFAQQSG